MIYSNALSTLILHHDLNGLCDKNLRLIQYVMRTSQPARKKFKRVSKDLPNLVILTRIATPREVQLKFMHMSVGNKYLGESISTFALAGYIEALKVISIDTSIAFAIYGNKIRIPVTEVLLCVIV